EVERLGLASDILEHIPFDGNGMANEHTGSLPKGFWDWLVSIFVGFLELVIFIFTLPFLLFGLLLTALVYIGITLIGPILGAIALLLLKIILIIFIFIMFAISLFFALITFLALIVIIGIIAIVTGQSMSLGLFFIEFTLWGIQGRYEATIFWTPNEFLGISVPSLRTEISLADVPLITYTEGMALGSSNVEDNYFEIEEEPPNTEPIPDNPSTQSNGNEEPILSTQSNGNKEPILSGGKVTPPSGGLAQAYYYEVTYTDIDNDAPEFIYVSIGPFPGVSFELFKADPSDNIYSDGVIYQRTINGDTISNALDGLRGNIPFHFIASDGVQGHTVYDPPDWEEDTENNVHIFNIFPLSILETVGAIGFGLNWIGALMMPAWFLFTLAHYTGASPTASLICMFGLISIAIGIGLGIGAFFAKKDVEGAFWVLGLGMGFLLMWNRIRDVRNHPEDALKMYDAWNKVKKWELIIFTLLDTIAAGMGGYGLFTEDLTSEVIAGIVGITIFFSTALWWVGLNVMAMYGKQKGNPVLTTGKKWANRAQNIIALAGLILLTLGIIKLLKYFGVPGLKDVGFF
ncbi:MAG: hypothetical protein ACTSQ8_23560, partial [Candidatus Helarchaeota archaeon]